MMNLTTFLTKASLRLIGVKTRNFASLIALLSGASVSCYAIQNDFVPLPQYTTNDAFGVNVSGNTVTPTVNTLAMGGEMGLSHNITLQGNIFTTDYGAYGYRDKFAGNVRYTYLGTKRLIGQPYPINNLWVLTATAMGDSAQFVEMCNGKFTGDLPANSCSPIYYEAVKDKRHTLTVKGSNVVWTKPDGTEVYFDSVGLSSATNGAFKKIIYPNGFTINVSYYSVTTNTGFQLKYDYVPDTRYVGDVVVDITTYAPQKINPNWWQENPSAINAINNAYEYCADQQAPCALVKTWPKVTFEWPRGMPRAFYLHPSVFRVTNPTGATAEYNYDPQDANKGIVSPANTNIAPRLVSIKPFGASKPTVSYTYKNPYHTVGNSNGSGWYTNPGDPGILTGASGVAGSFTEYNSWDLEGAHGKGYKGYRLSVDMDETYPSRLERIIADDRTIVFDQSNSADQVLTDDSGLSSKKYTFVNNNIQTVIDKATGTTEAGGYPASCINPTPDRNRKTCNKPGWVKVNGNTTTYTYHEPSGQVQTVTSPADKNGLSAVVRYGYELKYAKYIQTPGGSPVQASTGVWLKVSEKTCNNTATIGDACKGNSAIGISAEQDEVVTTYKYDNDNLLLTEVTVKAADSTLNVRTKRTCYQYDIYGNRIGETQPNAQRTSCTP